MIVVIDLYDHLHINQTNTENQPQFMIRLNKHARTITPNNVFCKHVHSHEPLGGRLFSHTRFALRFPALQTNTHTRARTHARAHTLSAERFYLLVRVRAYSLHSWWSAACVCVCSTTCVSLLTDTTHTGCLFTFVHAIRYVIYLYGLFHFWLDNIHRLNTDKITLHGKVIRRHRC